MNNNLRLTEDGRVYKKGKRIYANKDIYEGEFVDGLKHGRGILRYNNGNKYVGEFLNDFPDGYGVFTYIEINENGERSGKHRYEGDFKKGKRNGKGIYVAGNGDTYAGMFENNLYHGNGTLKLSNGDIYEGEWIKGRASGKNNIIKFQNGDIYTGGMKAGFLHGEGEYKWRKNQGSYQGQWFKGQPQGRGIRIFVNGNKFTGSFHNGRINGDGVMSYANGDQYIGSWLDGHKHGKGVIRYATGDRYEGEFYHGFYYGQGKYIWNDGSFYEGEYIKVAANKHTGISFPTPDGKRNGLGIRVWRNGNRYEGSWADDMMHGKGVLQKVEGGKYRGEFWNGLRSGVGSEEFGNTAGITFRCPMGVKHKGDGFCVYVGQFQSGYFHGIGEFICQNGRTYSGEWKQGKRHGKGTQSYLLEGEAGDPKRLFIGGVDSLYRFKKYEGQWVNDVKEGEGIATYVNDESIEGNFVSGQPHGVLLYRFTNGKKKYATYERGQRIEWTSDVAVNLKQALEWLDDAAAFRREFKNE